MLSVGKENFNPRTHVGCDTSKMLLCSLLTNFNPRTHVGCDSEDVSSGFTVSISIHAPTWGATPVARSTVLRGLFQSTHPRGVRPSHITIKVGTDKFQSTHPRGVRPGQQVTGQRLDNISIHAPTWGATHRTNDNRQPANISIHAPTWGATDESKRRNRFWDISIHAPTWGATDGSHRRLGRGAISIHAPTWGATQLCFNIFFNHEFQSTHPRGVRQQDDIYYSYFQHFNPRTHGGCDLFR